MGPPPAFADGMALAAVVLHDRELARAGDHLVESLQGAARARLARLRELPSAERAASIRAMARALRGMPEGRSAGAAGPGDAHLREALRRIERQGSPAARAARELGELGRDGTRTAHGGTAWDG
ncbi:MAG: hypothetical protein ACODAU_10545 [Myxococcota bacterium]